METAVIIKGGSCDATENSHNRELVAHHDDGRKGGMTSSDLFNSLPCPFFYIGNTLAPGDREVSRLLPPCTDKLRVVGMDLLKCQAFENSVVQLTEVALNPHL